MLWSHFDDTRAVIKISETLPCEVILSQRKSKNIDQVWKRKEKREIIRANAIAIRHIDWASKVKKWRKNKQE
jgi:hypothetical protein